MKILIASCLALMTVMAFGQSNVPAFPSVADIKIWDQYSGVKRMVVHGDSIVSTWQNGMLNGPFISYFPNGKVKAKGEFVNNYRTGKWFLFSEDGKGKAVIDFTERGNVFLHRARIPGKGGVRFGKGKIVSSVPDFNVLPDDTAVRFLQCEVPFRHGMKQGKEIEKYSDGTLRSETYYKYGLYDGVRKIYHPNGKIQFICEYKDGVPSGERKEYTPDGKLLSAHVIDMSGAGSAAFHLDRFDVFMASRKFVYSDTLFAATSLFFKPDSAQPLFKVLNDAFVKGDLSSYADDELREIYFPMHDKPDLSGLNADDGNYKNLRGFMYKVDEIFNTQTWLMYRYPLAIQPVASYERNDSLIFHGGPWLYFPQLRSEIPASAYHLSYFKSFSYPYMTAMQLGLFPRQVDYSDADDVAAEQLGSVVSEHNMWLLFYGLDKNWKGW